jgi:hypothetical protein
MELDDGGSTFDIAGDGDPDIVQTVDFDTSYDVWGKGTDAPYWRVFVGEKSPFFLEHHQKVLAKLHTPVYFCRRIVQF